MEWLKSADGILGGVGPKLIETISWKLAAEFHHRHHHDLKIIETHPGGGMYDCLSFVRDGELLGHLNREGGFTSAVSDFRLKWDELWPKAMSDEGLQEVLDAISRGCSLEAAQNSNPIDAGTLSYRVIAAVSMPMALAAETWEWRNGQSDTAGDSDQRVRDQWFVKLGMEDELIEAMRDGAELGGRYAYWFLLKEGEPKCCITSRGMFWVAAKQGRLLMRKIGEIPSTASLAGMVIMEIGEGPTRMPRGQKS